MAVGAKAKQRYVEERTGRIENRRTIGLLQSLFVAPSGVLWISVDRNGVNILRRYGCLSEHRLAGHPIIAFGTVVGHEALISPIPGDKLPGETAPEFVRR